jgi:hypothetical protein
MKSKGTACESRPSFCCLDPHRLPPGLSQPFVCAGLAVVAAAHLTVAVGLALAALLLAIPVALLVLLTVIRTATALLALAIGIALLALLAISVQSATLLTLPVLIFVPTGHVGLLLVVLAALGSWRRTAGPGHRVHRQDDLIGNQGKGLRKAAPGSWSMTAVKLISIMSLGSRERCRPALRPVRRAEWSAGRNCFGMLTIDT